METPSISIRVVLKKDDVVEWVNTRYVVTEIYAYDEIWGHRENDPTKFEFLLGYPDELTLVKRP